MIQISRMRLIAAIKIPTLIMVGEEDPGTPPAMSLQLHEQIAGSELVTIRSASHLSNLEQTETFNRTLLAFLLRHA
jgi:3-oxoadipate enol-lactonase